MRNRPFFFIIIFVLISSLSTGQTQNYSVRKASFSSEKFDEFSPVYYRGGLVYCSNRNSGLIQGYSTINNKGFFKMNYIDTTNNPHWQESRLLPGSVNSHFNNGPATFNPRGDTIYFSRNLIVEGSYRDVTNPGNKLGLFFAVLKNGEWTGVTELRFNDNSYNVTTPFLSPDGKRLYFASDKPEGYGGSDLYYSQWKDGYWNNPVNLGPSINTGGNEAYPFINSSGELFFSSDSLPGRGGKDIFFSKYVDTTWIKPVGLNAPVNSDHDDFGFIADNLTGSGYFSSNRENMLDIYKFKTIYPQFFYCIDQKENQYCIYQADDKSIDIDPISLQFQWDFGDGKKAKGYVVTHCFPGPGVYNVKQNIIEKKGEKVVFNKVNLELEIKETKLPYIKSDDSVVLGVPVTFDAGKEIPGYDILSYLWDFGNSGIERGANIIHTFKSNGELPAKLMVKMKERSTGKTSQICVSKKIVVRANANKPVQTPEDTTHALKSPGEIENGPNITINKRYSTKDALAEKAVFQVQVLSSSEKIPPGDSRFDNIIPEYAVKMIFQPGNKTYSYIIDEQLDFMASYPAFRDAVSRGFRDAKIITYIPAGGGEMELWNFKRTYGTASDMFFLNKGVSLSANGTSVLDQLVLLLKRNPGLKIMIASHTDNTGSSTDNLFLSRKQAGSIMDYLITRGIDKNRLSAAGFGSSRPIAPDYPESERKKNSRVDFITVN